MGLPSALTLCIVFFLSVYVRTSTAAACIQYGQYTGGWRMPDGSLQNLYDSYYIYDSGTPFFYVMPAGYPEGWGSGKGFCDGNQVILLLDGAEPLTGTITKNGTEIDWDNGSRWYLQTVTKVHVVFMNHLDVGYNGIAATGFINNVMNVYFHDHFPRVLRLQGALRSLGYPERYIYTTHPWLVSMYLDCPDLVLAGVQLMCPDSNQVAEFTAAITRGDITWHAGPYNLQPENMDASLFEYGLSIATDLDKRFGIQRKFGVLSQRDVPGMTRSVIPLLVKHNVAGITVGQNDGTPPVGVPKLYRWRDPDSGSEIIGINHPHGYGWINRVDDAIAPNGVALAYGFRSDNQGPPTSIQELLGVYASLRGQYPGATIVASTYENFVQDVLPVRNLLPVVQNEIGDVWIDGISSDPLKESQFREISRARTTCLNSGRCDPSDPRIKSFSRYLIKIPEHTWGLPGVYDSANWSNVLFDAARSGPNYQNCEAAWAEQRQFNQLAINALGDHPLAAEINARLAALTPIIPSTQRMTFLPMKSLLRCGNSTLQFDGVSGAVVNFFDGFKNWADPTHPIARLTYTSFNQSDFDYMATYYGGNAGYSKWNSTCSQPGCANPRDSLWLSVMSELWWNQTTCSGVITLLSQTNAFLMYGAPETAYLSFNVVPTSTGAVLNMTLIIWNKRPTRLPEQMMFEFRPRGSLNWQMDKLGSWVSPLEVVLNGSQYQHAVWSGIMGSDSSSSMFVSTPDAPLVSPITTQPAIKGWFGTPTAMPVPTAPLNGTTQLTGMAVNLFNNVWDTNYILWYPYNDTMVEDEQNMLFRFTVTTQNN